MPHDEIVRELEECQASGEFVAYHKWGDDPDIFIVGVVQELDGTKAVFCGVDQRGQFEPEDDAVPLRRIHTIHRGTAYLWRLRVLNEMGPTAFEKRIGKTRGEIRSILENAAQRGAIVRIWTSAHDADDYLIHAVGEETVAASNVLDGDQSDGRYVFRLRRIVKVRLGWREHDNLRVHRSGLAHGFPSG